MLNPQRSIPSRPYSFFPALVYRNMFTGTKNCHNFSGFETMIFQLQTFQTELRQSHQDHHFQLVFIHNSATSTTCSSQIPNPPSLPHPLPFSTVIRHPPRLVSPFLHLLPQQLRRCVRLRWSAFAARDDLPVVVLAGLDGLLLTGPEVLRRRER